MEPYLWLYCDYGRLKLGNLLESDDSGTGSAIDSRYRVSPAYTANAMGRNSAGRSDNMLTPNVLMLTKHTNGSLNLWQVADIIIHTTCSLLYCKTSAHHHYHPRISWQRKYWNKTAGSQYVSHIRLVSMLLLLVAYIVVESAAERVLPFLLWLILTAVQCSKLMYVITFYWVVCCRKFL